MEEQVLQAFRTAYQTTLWSDEARLFRDFDARGETQIPVDTVAGLMAMYAGLVDAERAATMLHRYRQRSANCWMVPSTPPDDPAFDPVRYLRGPVWVHTNWLLIRGLEDLGLRAQARELGEATLDLVRASGLYEYYHAYTGAGLGGLQFSWTAALVIDLLRRPVA